jgi:hypothetical protein
MNADIARGIIIKSFPRGVRKRQLNPQRVGFYELGVARELLNISKEYMEI